MVNTDEYFSIGEFAKLFHISKQTLFYYERNHIFAPAFTDANGYRYYSSKQYFTFEIVSALRTLGIPLKDIADYVKDRSPEKWESILSTQCDALSEKILHWTENRNRLIMHIDHLQWINDIRTDIITVEHQPSQTIAISPLPETSLSMKDSVVALANHKAPFFDPDLIYDRTTGYFVKEENVRNRSYTITHFVTPCAPTYSDAKEKASGLYVTIYKKNSYHRKYKEGLDKIYDFIERNDMDIVGDAYVFPIRNYWATEKPEDYITRISVAVDYKS